MISTSEESLSRCSLEGSRSHMLGWQRGVLIALGHPSTKTLLRPVTVLASQIHLNCIQILYKGGEGEAGFTLIMEVITGAIPGSLGPGSAFGMHPSSVNGTS